MTVITIDANDPASIDRALKTEWLLTNGLGGYAMGTVLGVNTRRYHGLLVAATKPPVGRIVALHSMIEQLIIPREDGSKEVIDLSTQQFVGPPPEGEPMLHPGGYRLLKEFVNASSGEVAWIFRLNQMQVTKRVWLDSGSNGAWISYAFKNVPIDLRLRLRPIAPMRDFHSLSSGEAVRTSSSHTAPGGVVIHDESVQVSISAAAHWRDDAQVWNNFAYSNDRDRGQDWVESLWSAGTLHADIPAGREFQLQIHAVAIRRGEERIFHAPNASRSSLSESHVDDPMRQLRSSAAQFIVRRETPSDANQRSIIAGYPWFGDWGRDTMISLPGLMLCTGRFDEARSTLLTFARALRNGLIPNLFDDYGGGAHYNSVDASLWFVHAVHELWRFPSPSGRGVRGEGITSRGVGEFVLDPDLLAFARNLRKYQTDAEQLLWDLLRNRRLLGMKFRRQHPIEPYVLDFYCPEAKLAIEVDGGQHNLPASRDRGEARTAFLASKGIRVLRFWNHEVLAETEAVLEAIVFALTPGPSPRGRRERDVTLLAACRAIIAAYRAGTDFNIRMDGDGLISAGDETTQLTWMDAKRDGIVFSPRYGKAVEINALWFNALCCVAEMTDDDRERDELLSLSERVAESFRVQFWWPQRGCLHDVLVPASRGASGFAPDGKLRPNQIFAVSLPFSPLTRDQQRGVVDVVTQRLLTPFGLRTLDRDDPNYKPRYEGNLFQRDAAYHNGTVWPWLIGPYCEAMLRVVDFSDDAKRRARQIIQPLIDEMSNTSGGRCLGQIAEVYDGDEPHRPSGCPAQAWSVAEVLRILTMVEGECFTIDD